MINRRQMLGMTGAAAITSIGGCKVPNDIFSIGSSGSCDFQLPDPEKPLRIDAHCHILNIHDVNPGRFAESRYSVPRGPVNLVANALGNTAITPEEERQKLAKEATKDISAEQVCENLAREREGTPFLNVTGANGFLVGRTANAYRLMNTFPDVDIFITLMVDLFEEHLDFENWLSGNGPSVEHAISTQIGFYLYMNIISKGRLLPMVSFNPARQFVLKRQQRVERDYFWWIKHAIENLGFVGVKVHPSYGFSPYNNVKCGCYPTSAGRIPSDKELKQLFLAYDEYMEQLYDLCRVLDVPILTHNNDSISANRFCMEGQRESSEVFTYPFRGRGAFKPRPESEWTNSSQAWINTVRQENAKGGAPLQVALGHFANGFKNPDRKMRTPLTRSKNPAEIVNSVWLNDVLEAKDPNVFLDTSILVVLFQGREGDPFRKRYIELFKNVLRSGGLNDRIIYGTDWHMPGASRIGSAYYLLMEELIMEVGGQQLVDAIMGGNAKRFFRLEKGQSNHERLLRFYKRVPDTELLKTKNVPVSLDEVGWLKKV